MATRASLPLTLARINKATKDEFVALVGGLVEHSPWVAEQVCGLRPFASVWALHAEMMACIQRASRQQKIALMRLHPELAGREAEKGTLTDSSSAEQARLGLLELSRSDHQRLRALNAAYRKKFGFPFITAVRLHDSLKSVFMALEQRTQNELDVEMAESLRQIGEVLRGRVGKLFGIPMGWLSMHVLDNVSGLPANGMAFSLSMLQGKKWSVISEGRTNAEGRTEAPLLCDASMKRGVYQFEFGVADYFRQQGAEIAEIPFLDRVPVRFGIDDLALHYHVPLLCTPWAYSTYRGN